MKKSRITIKIADISYGNDIEILSSQISEFPFPRRFSPWFENPYEIQERIENKKIIIAEDASYNKVVGYLAFDINSNFIDIDTVIVDKDHKRKGIGSKLMKYFISNIAKKNKNITKITTGSYKCFKDKGFYLKMGFKLIPLGEYEREDQIDWWEFERVILK
jgi:ribosomal protein S18 acetylase RimI-like enzyme